MPTQLVETKSLFASKTFWLNAVGLVVLVATALTNHPWVQSNPNTAYIVGAVLTVANIALRYVTSKPIE
jgi:FtsH-binding integral membrane protein